MISFLITAGGSFSSGWYAYWFTHGLSLVDIKLEEEDLNPVFFPKARINFVKGEKVK